MKVDLIKEHLFAVISVNYSLAKLLDVRMEPN